MSAETEATDLIRFRPSKKRKTYRQRLDQDAPEPEPHRAVAADFFDGSNDDEPAVPAAAVRLRISRKGRLQGVGFRAATHQPEKEERGLVTISRPQNGETAGLGSIAGRFTHQTGLINDVHDKHMNEYIESRLSSRQTQQATTSTPHNDMSEAPVTDTPSQPSMQGKLMEVDIPDESRAIKECQPQYSQKRGPKKQRLGPGDKPWRSRNRRGSDDIKRDQLVEKFLSENRLDIYDQAAETPLAPDADGDADERMAEEFRRQFMDDMARRQQKKKPVQANKPGTEDVLKGPRLGGSRNARAAVRDVLLKKEKEGK